VGPGEPFVCPECGKPLLDAATAAKRKPMMIQYLILGGISLLVLMAAAAIYIQVRHFGEKPPPGVLGTSFEDAEAAGERHEIIPSMHAQPADSPAPTPGPDAAPAASAAAAESQTPASQVEEAGVQAETPNLSLQEKQNQAVKDDVLKRIDLMPTITSDDKDKLYMSVERARQMGKILTIPFPSGHVAVAPVDVDALRAALATAQLAPLIKDPTCVFVVLGFADLKGDEKTNLHISTVRAQAVLNTLRDRCGVLNVMHAVGMGGSTLFGNEKDAERNRVVEVWAVLP
jgi:outer membrane protein OmpA-like peptidoglycan-associated protein